jgi:hypothetical protein
MPSPEERLRVPQELLAAAGMGFPPMQPPAAASPDIAAVHQDIGYPPDSFSGDQNIDVTLVAQQAAAAADISGGELVGLNLLGGTSPHGEQGPLASPSKPLLGGYATSSSTVQPAPAVTVPRMSNAFARKHGIDPRSNPLLNLRTIALQQQSIPQQVSKHFGRDVGDRCAEVGGCQVIAGLVKIFVGGTALHDDSLGGCASWTG